ncbi:hypothetical protein [Blautia wexlerae]|nr:hypothetical protein [Blautia wexlerae]
MVGSKMPIFILLAVEYIMAKQQKMQCAGKLGITAMLVSMFIKKKH